MTLCIPSFGKVTQLKLKFGPFEVGLCRYEKCIYYMNHVHPKTGLHCVFGHPACRLGKFDMAVTMYVADFTVHIVSSWQTFQCRIHGHVPYTVPAPPRVKHRIIACRRCGKKLGVEKSESRLS